MALKNEPTAHPGYGEALSRAMKFCAFRERCVSELHEKFREWNVDPASYDELTDELVESNFLDEKRYISSFVLGKFNGNKWGKVKIRQALREKKLQDNEIEAGLAKIDRDEYIRIATTLFRKKAEEVGPGDSRTAKSKLYYYMMSKGFETDLIMTLMKE